MLAGSSTDPAGSSTDPADGSTDLTEVSYTLSKVLLTELVMVVGAHMRGTWGAVCREAYRSHVPCLG